MTWMVIPALPRKLHVFLGKRAKQVPTGIKEQRELEGFWQDCALGACPCLGWYVHVCCGRGCELPDWDMGPAEVATITLFLGGYVRL